MSYKKMRHKAGLAIALTSLPIAFAIGFLPSVASYNQNTPTTLQSTQKSLSAATALVPTPATNTSSFDPLFVQNQLQTYAFSNDQTAYAFVQYQTSSSSAQILQYDLTNGRKKWNVDQSKITTFQSQSNKNGLASSPSNNNNNVTVSFGNLTYLPATLNSQAKLLAVTSIVTNQTTSTPPAAQASSATVQNYLAVIDWSKGDVEQLIALPDVQEVNPLVFATSLSAFSLQIALSYLQITPPAPTVGDDASAMASTGDHTHTKVVFKQALVTNFAGNGNKIDWTAKTIGDELLAKNFTGHFQLQTHLTNNNGFQFVFADAQQRHITVLKADFVNNSNENSFLANDFLHLQLPKPTTLQTNGDNGFQTRLVAFVNDHQNHLVWTATNDPNMYVVQYLDSNFGISNNLQIRTLLKPDASNNAMPMGNGVQPATNSTTAIITSIAPLFNNNQAVIGYLTLTNTNRVWHLNQTTSQINRFFDLDSVMLTNAAESPATPATNGNNEAKKVDFIYTLPNQTNWFARLQKDAEILQFNNNNFVGELSALQTNLVLFENLSNVVVRSQKEIADQSLFLQPVNLVNNTVGNDFTTFLNNNITAFLDLKAFDVNFSTPLFTANVIRINQPTPSVNNYIITIAFTQTLRSSMAGSLTDYANVVVGTQTYTFVNADVSSVIKPLAEVPFALQNKLPSAISLQDLPFLITVNNVGEHSFVLRPDDANGVLTVQLVTSLAWKNGQIMPNYSEMITIGTPDQPYFRKDLFNGLNADFDLVTDEYLMMLQTNPQNPNANQNLMNLLSIKYANTLPSQVTAQDILTDFILFGNAFDQANLADVLQKPDPLNVQLFPVDAQGYVHVETTIPRIGNRVNIPVAFNTAAIFKKDFSTHQDVYLVFKNNATVLANQIISQQQQLPTLFSNLLPSTLTTLIQNNNRLIFDFVDVSPFLYNIIDQAISTPFTNAIQLETIPNDSLGHLTIQLRFNQPITGLNNSLFTYTYTGFATTPNVALNPSIPSFSWGSIDVNAFLGRKATEIDATFLLTNVPQLFNENNAANQLRKTITVTPLSGSGAILVTVNYFDWWEQQMIEGMMQNVLLPQKTFTTVLSNGLSRSQEPVDMVVFKSFAELDSIFQNITPNTVLSLLSNANTTPLEQFKAFAFISNSLEQQLIANPNGLSLTLQADDSQGLIAIFARISVNNQDQSISNRISGFAIPNNSLTVVLAEPNSEAIRNLQGFLPSKIDNQQISSLINVATISDYTRQVQVEFDDRLGTLTLKVALIDPNTNAVVSQSEQTYTGFQTNEPEYRTTNLLIILASVLIPFGVLILPILFILFVRNRLDVRKFARRLDARISEKQPKQNFEKVRSLESFLKEIEKKSRT